MSNEPLPSSIKYILREYAESLFVAVLLGLFLRFFVVEAYRVPIERMVPTLLPGDFIVAYKLPYGLTIPFSGGSRVGGGVPRRGEVVVFSCPRHTDQTCVKRVVGLAGDRIEIKKRRLYLNGEPSVYERVEADPWVGALKKAVVREISPSGASHSVILPIEPEKSSFGPIVVPPGHMFVLNDHRGDLLDSRTWGTVPLNRLRGRIIGRWFSVNWSREGSQVRWSRVFSAVD